MQKMTSYSFLNLNTNVMGIRLIYRYMCFQLVYIYIYQSCDSNRITDMYKNEVQHQPAAMATSA